MQGGDSSESPWREQSTQLRLQIAKNVEEIPEGIELDGSSAEGATQDQLAGEPSQPELSELDESQGQEDVGPLDPEAYLDFMEQELLEEEKAIEERTRDDPEHQLYAGAEFEEGLSHAPFISIGDGARIDITLEVDEWLTEVAGLTKEQKNEAASWVEALHPPRYGNWLPWLKGRLWEARTLLAFLRFQAYWDKNWELWIVRIARPNHQWIERHMRNVMTREMALELATLRIEFAAEDMIDDDWIDEWWYRMPRELLEKGIYSLAEYALRMARSGGTEPWPEYPEKMSLPSVTNCTQTKEKLKTMGGLNWLQIEMLGD